jgi:hypothetical protein
MALSLAPCAFWIQDHDASAAVGLSQKMSALRCFNKQHAAKLLAARPRSTLTLNCCGRSSRQFEDSRTVSRLKGSLYDFLCSSFKHRDTYLSRRFCFTSACTFRGPPEPFCDSRTILYVGLMKNATSPGISSTLNSLSRSTNRFRYGVHAY